MAGSYYLAPENEDLSTIYPPKFTSFQTKSPHYHHRHAQKRIVNFSPSLSHNNSCTSDEGQMSVIDERKYRRRISNRESARRSRMRRQRQLDKLCTLVLELRDHNHGLMDKLNRVSETHERVVHENDMLKKETMELRKLLSEAQLASTFTALGDLGFLTDFDDDHEMVSSSCTTAHLRAQSSHKSNVASTTNASF